MIKEVTNEIAAFANKMYPEFVVSRKENVLDGTLPIFVFHSVVPQLFEAQLAYLKINGYVTVSADDAYKHIRGETVLPKRAVLLTFDDGMSSVWTYGYPLLKKYGYSATVFLTTSKIGECSNQVRPNGHDMGGTFDRSVSCVDDSEEPYLRWEEIRHMAVSNVVTPESHGHIHGNFSDDELPDSFIRPEMNVGMRFPNISAIHADLAQSKALIEAQVSGHIVRHFCFPYGRGSGAVACASRELGYQTNFWCLIPGARDNRVGTDSYRITRVKHDYIYRLPGKGRKTLFHIFLFKIMRRIKNEHVY